jgi:hypothetical protein
MVVAEEMPGVTIIVERRSARVRIDIQDLARCEYGQRENVPKVHRDDVGGHEIDFSRGVRPVAEASSLDLVRRPTPGGLHLHSPETAFAMEDEVEAVAVSPGFGHAKTQADGLEQECEFAIFSAAIQVNVGLLNEGINYR